MADDIDELILKANPILLGSGIPLFAGPINPRAVNLTSHKIYPNGFGLMRYGWRRSEPPGDHPRPECPRS